MDLLKYSCYFQQKIPRGRMIWYYLNLNKNGRTLRELLLMLDLYGHAIPIFTCCLFASYFNTWDYMFSIVLHLLPRTKINSSHSNLIRCMGIHLFTHHADLTQSIIIEISNPSSRPRIQWLIHPKGIYFTNWKVFPMLTWLNYICDLVWLLRLELLVDKMSMGF